MKKYIVPLLFLLAVPFLVGCATTTRDAEQVGYITAIETNGLIFKADFVYLKSELESSQEEVWCVEDNELFNQLKEIRDKKERVKVYYHDELIYWPSRCHNGVASGMIDKIEILTK